MATNPFAQFVQEETNPFAQFAAPTPVTPPGQIPGAPAGLVAPPAVPTREVPSIASKLLGGRGQAIGNILAGGVRGAGSIGATLLRPFETAEENAARRRAMDEALASMGAQPESAAFGLGKLGAEIAGTAGVGRVVAAPVQLLARAVPGLAPVATALQTGGVGRIKGITMGQRVGAGAVVGGANAALTEPSTTEIGAAIGAVVPFVGKGLGKLAALSGRALDFRGKQATKIAREAAGKQIDAIRAALRGTPAGETPAQATAGIQRNAFQSLLELGRETDQMSLTLKKQSDDLLGELSRMAQGGNQTDIANSIDASRKVLNALTRPMRETSLDAANQQKANSLNYVNTMLQRVFLQKQVPPPQGLQPLSVDRIIGAIDEARMQPGARVSTTQQQVLGRLRSQLLNAAEINGGTIDAYDLYTIRKEGVNEIIDALMVGRDPKVSKKVAADVLSIVRPEIDNAIERAGGAGWKNYLETFSKGAKDLEKRQMAAELLRMFKDSPQEYVKLVRGNNPSAVEAVFGPGNYDIFKEMSKEMSTLNKVAAYVEREGIITKASEKGREELARILKKHRKYTLIPNWFNPYVTAANMKLRDIQGRLNDETLRVIERAAQSNQSMLDLLEGLPRAERSKLMKMINGLGRTGAPVVQTPAARAAAIATMAPEEQQPQGIMSPEEQTQ